MERLESKPEKECSSSSSSRSSDSNWGSHAFRNGTGRWVHFLSGTERDAGHISSRSSLLRRSSNRINYLETDWPWGWTSLRRPIECGKLTLLRNFCSFS
ncbi:uncharacterized protein LOC105830344 [Monomorium pharaonis]|uniref:uncharacterized protein LOC105830344 n=1 Tax=Monomorium pharaonis TaxID=307658 RepID=UPI001746958C|nr:uncharacterized protein LOC105830344 [Monomorium pharaonis]